MIKPRVVLLSAFLSPLRSGAEACAEEVALRLSDRYDITIVTAKLRRDLPRRDLLAGKVPVVRVGFGIPFDKWLYPFLAPFAARKLKPDLLHAVLETFAGVALHGCTVIVPGVKQILTLQTTNRNFLRKHILRTPTKVTAISTLLAAQAAMLGRSDVTVIPNGISYEEIRAACAGVAKIPRRILFVGRLERMKGADILLEAVAQLPRPEEHLVATLHVVGDGSQMGALKKLSEELGLTDRVTFRGRLTGSDLLREYAEAEIFCGLSRSEALGNVFIEAQAASCAVIATHVGGIPDVVKDGITGLLIAPENSRAAAQALRSMLTHEDLRTHCGATGIENARQYDWNGIAERYAALYQSLL